jgi:predicted histidine transporter YuiF (NhaC family)
MGKDRKNPTRRNPMVIAILVVLGIGSMFLGRYVPLPILIGVSVAAIIAGVVLGRAGK